MMGRSEARGMLALWLLPELIIRTNLEDHLILVHVLLERELGQGRREVRGMLAL